MKAKINKNLQVGKTKIYSTQGVANFCLLFGKENICPNLSYAKCVKIESDINTDTGVIMYLCEDGTLISENGYHYDINCFI